MLHRGVALMADLRRPGANPGLALRQRPGVPSRARLFQCPAGVRGLTELA
jgi:hypothetical protein